MEHKKLVKSHGILSSVMKFYQFCPQNIPNLIFLVTTKKLSMDVESLHFPKNAMNANSQREMVMEN